MILIFEDFLLEEITMKLLYHLEENSFVIPAKAGI